MPFLVSLFFQFLIPNLKQMVPFFKFSCLLRLSNFITAFELTAKEQACLWSTHTTKDDCITHEDCQQPDYQWCEHLNPFNKSTRTLCCSRSYSPSSTPSVASLAKRDPSTKKQPWTTEQACKWRWNKKVDDCASDSDCDATYFKYCNPSEPKKPCSRKMCCFNPAPAPAPKQNPIISFFKLFG